MQKNLTTVKTFHPSPFKNCYWMGSGSVPEEFGLDRKKLNFGRLKNLYF